MAGVPNNNPFFTFDCTDLDVKDSGGNLAQIVQNSASPFTVATDFVFGGNLASLILALVTLTFTVTYSLESQTGGATQTITDTGSTVAGQLNYNSTVTVATGTLPADLYEVSVVVNINGFPITGFFSEVYLEVF